MNLWEWAISFVATCINEVFSLFDRVFSALPGAWATLLTFVVILAIQRFLLKPLGFGAGKSDSVKKNKGNGDDE